MTPSAFVEDEQPKREPEQGSEQGAHELDELGHEPMKSVMNPMSRAMKEE